MGKFVGKDLIIGAEGKVINNYKLDDVVARPTGQGYGAARKGTQVSGTIEAQIKEESTEYKTEDA